MGLRFVHWPATAEAAAALWPFHTISILFGLGLFFFMFRNVNLKFIIGYGSAHFEWIFSR